MNIFKNSKYQRFMMAVSALGLVCLSTPSVLAQDGPKRGNPEARIERMMEELDITEAQQEEFRAAMAHIAEEQMQQRKNMRDAMEQNRDERREMRDERRDTAQADRREERKDMKEQRSEMLKQRRAEIQQRNEEILSSVLTEDQLAKFRELASNRQERMGERPRR